MSEYYKARPNLNAGENALVATGHSILSKRSIQIEKGEYTSKEWKKIFPLLQSSASVKLSLYANEAEIDLKCIFVPHFAQLKELVLSCNNIISIEPIVNLHAPNLQDLMLLTNKITNIRALRKAYFPHLKQINLSNNPIQDPTPLSQLCSKEIGQIHLERWPNLPMIGESKRWTAKLQADGRQLKALSLKSYGRRGEAHIDRMIMAKYPNLKI